MSSTVAIIMRAKNEMPHVQRSLEMLQQQSFQDAELHAVDSGSSDGTLEALCNACPNDRLTQIAPADYVPGRVLNDAIARTDHGIIVLLNADAIPQSGDWLEKLIDPIMGNEADATYCKQVARPDAKFIVAYDYERAYNPAQIDSRFFSAVACSFKRELWETHPFRQQGYAEDAAWARTCIANGARFRFVENSVVEHSHNYTLKELHQKRYRQAVAQGTNSNTARLLREIARDFLYAGLKLKLHTIPYNIAYRITIHSATHQGCKERCV